MYSSLCNTFRSQAFWTWDTLAKGRSVNSQIGEETLTDMNILELKLRNPLEVYSRTFTKRQEGNNGADWEWWFTGSSKKWIGFRVQAKVIDFKTNAFEHLHYRGKKNKETNIYPDYQCDILIKKALEKPFPRIPLYCLYSNWNTLSSIPWSCHTYKLTPESYGCSILSAFLVCYLRSQGIQKTQQLKALLSYINPWHCLVCCHGYGDTDLPNRVFEYWRNAILQLEESVFDQVSESNNEQLSGEWNSLREVYTQIQPSDEVPNYVQSLLNNELEEQPDPNLRTVTIFKEP